MRGGGEGGGGDGGAASVVQMQVVGSAGQAADVEASWLNSTMPCQLMQPAYSFGCWTSPKVLPMLWAHCSHAV